MTLARTAQASTPAVAIARVLRGIGLKQGPGKDFRVMGNYRTGRYADGTRFKERTGTYVTLYTRRAEDTVAANADIIERAANNTGWRFHVNIYYGTRTTPQCLIGNEGTRVRETPPPAPGEQPASTLSIGDRYVTAGQEVTVAYVWPNDNGTLTVHHQTADPVATKTCPTSTPVQVTHRAPRCPHHIAWDDCLHCPDDMWPEEVEEAYMQRMPARTRALSAPAAPAEPAPEPTPAAPALDPVEGCPGPARAHCAYCGSHSTRPQDLLTNGDTYCCSAPVCRGDRGDCVAELEAYEKSFTP